ncbi:hypothetical protein J3U57_12390 [Gilliamella sp. B3464]|uniref:hypothetical protein n=1 Tax=unclassified Gilliamella TaxID=2685620 RepID=UPI00226A5272|nr:MULTISPECIES: hypothetical protein [unclassified Gilliamella]MCX8713310.1 hypothetical protein [Gilliamella sp. B3468]MCX8726502.1 hypothetical protein [Gilliamella sp. B2838]MCX8752371.1 hypothetical protein [Gilliamella sp. B3464]
MLQNLINGLNENKTNCYRYLLVDALKSLRDIELLTLDNIKGVFSKEDVQPVLRSDLYYDPNHCPHLILLAKPNEDIELELIELMLRTSQKEQELYRHYICGWISSELSIDLLAEKLVEYGNKLGTLSNPETNEFVPFFEHVRLQVIKECLLQENATLFYFDFAANYIFLNYYGELEILRNLNNANTLSSFQNIFLKKALQKQQQPILVFGLADLWKEYADFFPHDALLRSANQIIHAKSIGLTKGEDIISYSFYSLMSGKDLMKYKNFSDAVKLAIEDSITLNETFETFSQSMWNEIGIEVE